jgi:hypothetical protein
VDRAVTKVDRNTLIEKDLDKMGTGWTEVPCKQLAVRITYPYLPYGLQGPIKRIRRTFLPWFVAVYEDSELEVYDRGTLEDLRIAYRDLTAPLKTPSGLSNMYGKILYRFPAAVRLEPVRPIQAALVA